MTYFVCVIEWFIFDLFIGQDCLLLDKLDEKCNGSALLPRVVPR